MITVIAKAKAKEGSEGIIEEAFKSIFPEVEKEEGTLVYTLHKNPESKGEFLFYEKFRDMKSFELHNSTPHLKKLFSEFSPFLEEDPVVTVYKEIAALEDCLR